MISFVLEAAMCCDIEAVHKVKGGGPYNKEEEINVK